MFPSFPRTLRYSDPSAETLCWRAAETQGRKTTFLALYCKAPVHFPKKWNCSCLYVNMREVSGVLGNAAPVELAVHRGVYAFVCSAPYACTMSAGEAMNAHLTGHLVQAAFSPSTQRAQEATTLHCSTTLSHN